MTEIVVDEGGEARGIACCNVDSGGMETGLGASRCS